MSDILLCNFCWWREGDRCYVEPCKRNKKTGQSIKLADKGCDKYLNKRAYFINAFNK